MEQLTQSEAERLLHMVKKSLISQINFPGSGDSTDFEVVGENKRDLFIIDIYKGKINKNKFNIGARIKKNNIILLELHIGATNRHLNPSGTIVTGSHWHIYSEKYGIKEAFPAEDINSLDFVEKTMLFFEKFNLVEKPIINYQFELI